MKKRTPKFIFVVGGVMSSVGKGVTSASIGTLLQAYGYSVTLIKADPYVNVDAGTMNPTEHGEVFVTVDGDETDQDIGNYERFLNVDLPSINYMTTGRVYLSVIERERNLDYGGKCVEVVPHIPEEILRRIHAAQKKARADFTIIEIGGTVGEYQNILFLEAARVLKLKHPDDVRFVLVSYLPIPEMVGEMKTKPTQYASRTLNSVGIQADFIICRAAHSLDRPRRERLAILCGIPIQHAISNPDMDSIYRVPLALEKEGLGRKLLTSFGLPARRPRLGPWQRLGRQIEGSPDGIRIAMVGKYFETGAFTLADSYISVIEAIKHAGWSINRRVEFAWISAEEFERHPERLKRLNTFHGIVVPGGFGSRGTEGVIHAIRYCREQGIPFFGLCYGMQLAAIEFARHVAHLPNAHTTEVDLKTTDPVIMINDLQRTNVLHKRYGGSMRLGAYACSLAKQTISAAAYGKRMISERHRHRYEFNNAYRERLQEAGLVLAGINAENDLIEIIELARGVHPFFVGVQFHPEFTSRPLSPHPLFRAFIDAAAKQKPVLKPAEER